jgi:rhamnosyl/mannosyltransferase
MWALLKSGYRGPLIVHYHFDISRFGPLQKAVAPVLQETLRRADRIFVNSQSYAASSPVLADWLDKCVYIPAGVAPARFALTPLVQARAAELRQNDRFRVLFVGRLSHYKGLEGLLEAMQSVDGELHLIGRGKLARSLEQQAARLGIADRVQLLGRLPEAELVARYHAADVVVLPSVSRGESFGVVQVEAMLCGRPVICSDLPGVRDVGIDGQTCLQFSAGDVVALTQALNRLKDDPALRAKMGQAGRQRALAEYDVDKLNARRWQVYCELLGLEDEHLVSSAG